MKTIIFDGDSICQASSEAKGTVERGWPYRIGTKNQMNWHNFGIGGGTITAEMYSKVTGNARHWVSRNIDEIHKQFENVDYLILEGGTNDADLLRDFPEQFGEVNPTDFTGSYDDTTFCGAVETLFFKARTYYPSAKIGFIIAPKMGVDDENEIHFRRVFFLKIMEICRKWDIPYIDLWETSPLDPKSIEYFDSTLTLEENVAAGKAYVDGQHLSKVGYDIITPAIDAWIQTL